MNKQKPWDKGVQNTVSVVLFSPAPNYYETNINVLLQQFDLEYLQTAYSQINA